MSGASYDAHMVDRDSAFLWETEALRDAPPRPVRLAAAADINEAAGDWATLREANEATGIPIATLRKWARRDSVPSYLKETPVGQLRMVSMKGVYRRAADLGREVKTTPRPGRQSPPAEVRMAMEPETAPEVTVAQSETGAEEVDSAGGGDPGEPTAQETPPGTMLVPIDAWDKMLAQLGNLHEAGQQLAEARERAAKAETETVFLRERLAELRERLAHAESPPTVTPPSNSAPETAVAEPAPLDEDDQEEIEIDVREIEDSPSPEDEREEDGTMSVPAYSFAVVRHLYGTWKNRPKR